jgi:hypothetical protein
MKVRFVAERGNKGDDNVEVNLFGIKNLPKFVIITAEDFTTAIGTGKVFIDNSELKVEADLREQEFHLYPTIGFESLVEENINGFVLIRELELHTVSLQYNPNTDSHIKTIMEQINNGMAKILE